MIRNTVTLLSGFTVLSIVCSSCAGEILQCYYCTDQVGPDIDKPLPLCSQLKNAPEFKVLCPNSTMCRKTVSTMNLKNGTKWSTAIRGCADQVNIRLELINKLYENIAFIDEPYEIGCTEKKSDNMLTVKVQECYCRGSLCNSTTHLDLNKSTYIMYAMFLLIIIQSLIGN